MTERPDESGILEVEQIGLLEDDEIELDVAALALSELDHDGIDLAPYLELLDQIEASVRDDIVEDTPRIDKQVASLARVFVLRFGFEGDSDSYDAPINADMIRVLDRRRGLPVSLSLLYVSAARRMGWMACALNTPGHVLVRHGKDPHAIVDPFNGFAQLEQEEVESLLRPFIGSARLPNADQFEPMSNRMVLLRLLRNQATRAEQDGDHTRALTMYSRMNLIAPSVPDTWWELARLQLALGDPDSAKHSLSAMLEVTRDPEWRKHVAAALEAIASA